MSVIEIKVPDIGDFSDVDVIEVLVKAGDTVAVDDALITLESDKASMDIPSSAAGTVKEMKITVGGKASEGTVICLLEVAGAAAAASVPAPAAPAPAPK
ncbi:MAG TPA: dihydrolipoyl dehydrogenase, partial [Thiolinea sp.]|nr:dihydrolipoyl dehydrogenase [Thiolinea sp.]